MRLILFLILSFISIQCFAQNKISREEWLRKNYEEDISKITDKNRVVLRLCWWRAFHPNTIIRVENFPVVLRDSLFVEQYAVSKVYLDKVNDYQKANRPYLSDQQNREITKADMDALLEIVEGIKFWKLKSDKVEIIDGSNWELEIYKNGKYHIITSNSVNPKLKRIGIEMIKLSGLKVEEKEIY